MRIVVVVVEESLHKFSELVIDGANHERTQQGARHWWWWRREGMNHVGLKNVASSIRLDHVSNLVANLGARVGVISPFPNVISLVVTAELQKAMTFMRANISRIMLVLLAADGVVRYSSL